jgi:O-antigen ligase
LLAVELVYLISLQSRTSYAALAGASVFLAVLPAVRSGRRALRAALAIAAAVGLLTAAGLADAGARQRIRSLLAYVAHPASYLESDRGTYLLNSLNMVRCHPWGIGLGDWQTQYPVYRLHHRYVYFSATEQVNKAHSDHIEIFAETGWPGLFLWLGFWAALLLPLARLYFLAVARGGGTLYRTRHDQRAPPPQPSRASQEEEARRGPPCRRVRHDG